MQGVVRECSGDQGYMPAPPPFFLSPTSHPPPTAIATRAYNSYTLSHFTLLFVWKGEVLTGGTSRH